MKKINIGYIHWLLVSVGFVLLWGVVTSTVGKNFSEQKELLLSTEVTLVSSRANTILKTYELFSRYIFSDVVEHPGVLEIISKANSADEGEKEILRKELYRLLENDYEEMQKYDFRQLHFQLPMGESFLRFHSPENFGDNLYKYRDSIRIVNDEQRYISGFEEGRVNNGYRFMYPVFYADKFVGSVEVSVSMATIIKTLSGLYPNIDNYFIIKKSIVDKSALNDNLDYYETSFFSEEYYFDKKVNELTLAGNGLLSEGDFQLILKHITDSYQNLLSKQESFSVIEKFDGKHYQICFLSINNISNLHTGYLITVSQNETYKLINQAAILISALFILIFVIFQIALFIFMRNQMRTKELAEKDSLTELINRQKFTLIATKEMERSVRYKRELCLFMLDIDHFKHINDQYGHGIGDQVLIKLAQLVSNHMRTSDTFARWGGEEFIGLLPETSLEKGINAVEKIRTLIADHDFELDKPVTVSIGITELIDCGDNIDLFVDAADQALYQAKSGGRNRVCAI
ncbi:MAG: hypothetical protein CVU43_09910 [Chloroflexi bacterium HGW-Chloroflexi-5]|jgi:diguanylate cyclase (GGDEF)-like protein|nr:MAG: hypothetical protein CVU43_09910 [Chloroflexi bacterium HGW-Chloroflexi-5]